MATTFRPYVRPCYGNGTFKIDVSAYGEELDPRSRSPWVYRQGDLRSVLCAEGASNHVRLRLPWPVAVVNTANYTFLPGMIGDFRTYVGF